MKLGSAIGTAVVLCGVSCFLIQKVKAARPYGKTGKKGSKHQLAVVSVLGDVNKHDDVTLSVRTAQGVSRRQLRRVEHSLLHRHLTPFTVVGHQNGKAVLRWENVSTEAREKARQFFYSIDSGTVVSIITAKAGGSSLQVKGFLDHDTRISPVERQGDGGRGGGRRRERRESEGGDHRVWRQADRNAEWRILSQFGITPPPRARRPHQENDDDDDGDDDDGDDDDDDERDDGSVHKDDYLKVPAMFLDKSLWVTHNSNNNNNHHHHDDDDNNDNDDDEDEHHHFVHNALRNHDDERRRRRKRQSVMDTQQNPFHATFSSQLAALASLGPSPPPPPSLPLPPGSSSTGSSEPFTGTYVVEVMVMVDVKTYSTFKFDPVLLEDYILHFWQVVNLRLRAIIDPRIQLRIRSYGKILFSGFQQFIENSRVRVGSQSLVSLADVIENFRGWMESYETNTQYSGHDVAILMTGENLCKLAQNGTCPDSPKGIGYMGGACITSRRFQGYTYDVAVAEVDRSYRGVLTATHELGHLLNASHDGEGGATGCGSMSGYIMSYSWKDATKFNRFSPCSKLSISRFLSDTWYSECLRDVSDRAYVLRTSLPGHSMSIKDQCLHYNAGVPCSSRSLESQCANLCCENILKVSVSSEPAVDGTICGHDKICFAGQCIYKGAVSRFLPP